MGVGHFGLAITFKKVEPRLSLVTLTLAALFVDLLWVIFVMLGLEQVRIVPGYTAASPLEFVSYPLSHSLVAAFSWAAVLGAVYYAWPTRDTTHHTRRTLIVMFLVASHWLLDVASHTPDVPLAGDDSTKLGLGLWRSVPATLAVEIGMLAVGLALLIIWPPKRYQPRTWRLLLVGLIFAVMEVASVLGPPPPSVRALTLGTLAAIPVIILLTLWADRPVKTG
jgi:hypothetical protein